MTIAPPADAYRLPCLIPSDMASSIWPCTIYARHVIACYHYHRADDVFKSPNASEPHRMRCKSDEIAGGGELDGIWETGKTANRRYDGGSSFDQQQSRHLRVQKGKGCIKTHSRLLKRDDKNQNCLLPESNEGSSHYECDAVPLSQGGDNGAEFNHN